MAFTYTPGSGKRDDVRLLVADTDTARSENQIFTDAEIDAFLSLESSEVYAAAAAACSAVAASASRSAVAWRVMDSSLDMKAVPKAYRDLAKDYRARAVAAPSEEIDSLDYTIGPFGQDRSEYVGDRV